MAPLGGRGRLLERAYGAGKPGLNLDNIRSLPIPLPPLPEQRRIIAKEQQLMELCDHLEISLRTEQDKKGAILDAILHNNLEDVPQSGSKGNEQVSRLRCITLTQPKIRSRIRVCKKISGAIDITYTIIYIIQNNDYKNGHCI